MKYLQKLTLQLKFNVASTYLSSSLSALYRPYPHLANHQSGHSHLSSVPGFRKVDHIPRYVVTFQAKMETVTWTPLQETYPTKYLQKLTLH